MLATAYVSEFSHAFCWHFIPACFRPYERSVSRAEWKHSSYLGFEACLLPLNGQLSKA